MLSHHCHSPTKTVAPVTLFENAWTLSHAIPSRNNILLGQSIACTSHRILSPYILNPQGSPVVRLRQRNMVIISTDGVDRALNSSVMSADVIELVNDDLVWFRTAGSPSQIR